MMPNKGLTVAELAARVGGRVSGDESVRVRKVASLADADQDSIAFVEEVKLLDAAYASRAACVIVPEGGRVEGKCMIEAARPKLAFALIAEALYRRSAESLTSTQRLRSR